MTTGAGVVIISNVKAVELLRARVVYSEIAFAELVLWRISKPLVGSKHRYKYRLAYVVRGKCVVRYDNESGKGDHRHYHGRESKYAFFTADKLIADFQHDIARWNHENSHS